MSNEVRIRNRTRPTTGRSLAGPLALGLLIGLLIVAGGAVAFRIHYLIRTAIALASTTATTQGPMPTAPTMVNGEPLATKPTELKGNTPSLKKEPSERLIGPPLPPPPPPNAKVSISTKETVPIACPVDRIRDIRVSPGKGDVPSVFVMRRESDGFQGVGATDLIQRITRRGRAAGQVEVFADKVPARRIFQVTDTAQRVLVEAPAGRLTLYDFERQEKLWEGHDVYTGLMDRRGPAADAFFLTSDTLLTVDQRGTVDTWDVTTKERTGQGIVPGGGSGSGPVIATRSSNSTVVIVGRQVFAYERASTNAAPVSELPIGAEPVAADADPLGKQIAIVYRIANHVPKHSLIVVKIGVNEPQMRCVLPDTFGIPHGVGWIGLDTIAVTMADRAAVLVDTERAVPFGYVKEAEAMPFVNEFGLFQYTTADPEDDRKSILTCVEVPFDGYRQMVREASAARLPFYFAPRADGLAR